MPASGALDLLMVSGEYPPSIGGVGDYTEILCRALLRHGMKVGVLTTQRAAVHGHRDDGLHVLRTVDKWDRECWGRVAGAARETGARIVHFQYQAAAYQLHGAVNLLPLFQRLRTPGVRTVTTFHDLKVPYLFPKAGRLRKASLRAMARYSDGLVLTNGADLAEMGGDQKGRRWCIPIGSNIPNSPPISYDRQEWRRTRFCAAPETLVLAYFGLANLSKGIEVAVQAASILRARGTDVRLVVVGGQEGASDPTNRAYAGSLS
ncbi:MAG TPA: glycosyltransferase, partial [Chloroflexota bacterium]